MNTNELGKSLLNHIKNEHIGIKTCTQEGCGFSEYANTNDNQLQILAITALGLTISEYNQIMLFIL